jgi:hypothetical protein
MFSNENEERLKEDGGREMKSVCLQYKSNNLDLDRRNSKIDL